MVEACEGKEDIMRSYSGQCALNPWRGFFKDPTLHAGIDFDDKILSWYFATKMFLSWSRVDEQDHVVEAIRAVSNYMIFLLVERPYMLPSPVRPGLYASTEVVYVGLDFSDRESISKQLGLDRRRRMWDLDSRRDGDNLHRVRGKLEIIREDLDRKSGDLDRRRWDFHSGFVELNRMRMELDKSGEELDDLRLEVGGRREKLEVLDSRREELDRRREGLVGMLEYGNGEEELKELDRRRSEVDGTREENLDLDPEKLNRTMKKLEELDRRSEELRFGPSPPPPLIRGAELLVWLLEAEVQGKQVQRVLLGVWVEMMCYASHHCSRDSHARQLNSGGEFITVIWLLSTAVFNRSYCDEDWFKKGGQEFFRRPFHLEVEELRLLMEVRDAYRRTLGEIAS